MHKKHIITIAGRPGSGKSTASKTVAAQLGYKHFSGGDLLRALGKERGMDIFQTNLTAEKEKELDDAVDQTLHKMGETQDELVIDARLAWHWIPSSFKVYLDLDLETAAHRILQGIDEFRLAHEHIPDDPKAYAKRLRDRLASETRRYQNSYGVDPHTKGNYDLVIDTSRHAADEVARQILAAYESWLKSSQS